MSKSFFCNKGSAILNKNCMPRKLVWHMPTKAVIFLQLMANAKHVHTKGQSCVCKEQSCSSFCKGQSYLASQTSYMWIQINANLYLNKPAHCLWELHLTSSFDPCGQSHLPLRTNTYWMQNELGHLNFIWYWKFSQFSNCSPVLHGGMPFTTSLKLHKSTRSKQRSSAIVQGNFPLSWQISRTVSLCFISCKLDKAVDVVFVWIEWPADCFDGKAKMYLMQKPLATCK